MVGNLNLVEVSRNIMQTNMNVVKNETVLILCDPPKVAIGEAMLSAAQELTVNALLIEIPKSKRAGEEPPVIAANAMQEADVAICITENSITHTLAKEMAVQHGTRVATMPGITEKMFFEGAITADYDQVEKKTWLLTKKLTAAQSVLIRKGKEELTFSIKDRKGIASTGVHRKKGDSGNLPSGEAYIAPVEGTANGTISVDGSFVGVGKLKEPIRLIIKNGQLVDIVGYCRESILNLLGDGDGRNVAEFGIGTNDSARVTGLILEDEKVAGTIHIAFGSNKTFGGNIDAGVHLDGVVLEPTFYLEDKLIMEKGKWI